jgi:hypothetical protein
LSPTPLGPRPAVDGPAPRSPRRPRPRPRPRRPYLTGAGGAVDGSTARRHQSRHRCRSRCRPHPRRAGRSRRCQRTSAPTATAASAAAATPTRGVELVLVLGTFFVNGDRLRLNGGRLGTATDPPGPPTPRRLRLHSLGLGLGLRLGSTRSRRPRRVTRSVPVSADSRSASAGDADSGSGAMKKTAVVGAIRGGRAARGLVRSPGSGPASARTRCVLAGARPAGASTNHGSFRRIRPEPELPAFGAPSRARLAPEVHPSATSGSAPSGNDLGGGALRRPPAAHGAIGGAGGPLSSLELRRRALRWPLAGRRWRTGVTAALLPSLLGLGGCAWHAGSSPAAALPAVVSGHADKSPVPAPRARLHAATQGSPTNDVSRPHHLSERGRKSATNTINARPGRTNPR